MWDITADSVPISTIHSVKGLDSEAVLVLGLDGLNSEDKGSTLPLRAQLTSAYVVCTMARRILEIIYKEKTPLIEYGETIGANIANKFFPSCLYLLFFDVFGSS